MSKKLSNKSKVISAVLVLVFVAIAITLYGLNSISAATVTSDGFAKGTTGGSGGTSVTVSNATSLISAAASSSSMIITVSGSIDLGSTKLSVNSNKTIQGANSSATIKGNVCVSNVSNVIINNLNITNPSGVGTGDGIEVSGSTKVFITKCTLTDCADGSIDIVRAADYVTVSWCRFRYVNQTEHNFVNLIGNGDDVTTDAGKLHVTMHHNWYDNGCKQRMPRVRYGQVHCYNNYYGASSNDYCVGVGVYSQILLENCYFYNQSNAWSNASTTTSNQGKIHWNSGNVFSGTSVPTWAANSTVFSPSSTYSYTLDTGSNVKSIVTSGAGNTSGVTFYKDYNYSGTAVTLGVGNYTMTQLAAAGVQNDWVSSIKVPSGYTVVAYENDNFGGASLTFTSDVSNLGSLGFNDKISSIKITN